LSIVQVLGIWIPALAIACRRRAWTRLWLDRNDS
jgi:hypothetical protein